MGMSRNIKLVLEYDGTNYHGWQAQAGTGRPTVQESLESAIKGVSGKDATTYASGRTDAGVHALGLVVNFHAPGAMPPAAWMPALNHVLPPDIRVVHSEEVPEEFHARYSAQGKTYTYRILNRRAPSALYRNYAWHVNVRLKLRPMRQAATSLIGKHDFSSFRGSRCGARSPIRTLRRVEIGKRGEFVELVMEADAFLQYMVRNIAGTLVEVGLGRFAPEDVAAILAAQDRTRAGRTAPPHGLYLVAVHYNGE
ncbi:MAG TPA: tRNA pseudouridine(38-40) synthase TruA [Nitrospirota bacterium]|nr:tRNA pseudouridine(38-40) synthase TruA [Nitrospirota bacterium]